MPIANHKYEPPKHNVPSESSFIWLQEFKKIFSCSTYTKDRTVGVFSTLVVDFGFQTGKSSANGELTPEDLRKPPWEINSGVFYKSSCAYSNT